MGRCARKKQVLLGLRLLRNDENFARMATVWCSYALACCLWLPCGKEAALGAAVAGGDGGVRSGDVCGEADGEGSGGGGAVAGEYFGEPVGADSVCAPSDLALSEEDAEAAHKVWFWNGHAATTIDLGLKRESVATGSNQAVTEEARRLILRRTARIYSGLPIRREGCSAKMWTFLRRRPGRLGGPT